MLTLFSIHHIGFLGEKMSIPIFNCSICGRVFYFKHNLESHVKEAHHPVFNPSKREKSYKLHTKLLTCTHCHKKFLCRARATRKYPAVSPECEAKKECECELCHVGNKGDPYCGNVKAFNPSKRKNDF